MAWREVASGGILDATELQQYEQYISEGQRGLIQLKLRAEAPAFVVSELEQKLREAGVEDVKVEAGSPLLRIYFRKGFPWLAVIAIAILGLIVLSILIVSWQLFGEIAEVIPAPILAGGTVVLVIAAVLIMLAPRRRKYVS